MRNDGRRLPELLFSCDSRYPVSYITKSTSFEANQEHMDEIMYRYGQPDQIWSDNRPFYNGGEWIKFTTGWNITPKFTMPYHPEANGMVEKHNASLKKTIHAAIAEGPEKSHTRIQLCLQEHPALHDRGETL